MKRIAFLGLGRMGSAMASRLLARGYDVTVYNRTAARAQPLVAAGAELAQTPRDACANVEAVVAMTADDVSSKAMWLGDDGALAADLASKALAIECSTLSHEWAVQLGRRVAGELAGEGHRVVARYDVEPRLRDVHCPVLLVAATDDPHSFPSLPRLSSLLPNAQVARIEGGTVPLPDGHPEPFVAAVEQFLDTLPG